MDTIPASKQEVPGFHAWWGAASPSFPIGELVTIRKKEMDVNVLAVIVQGVRTLQVASNYNI